MNVTPRRKARMNPRPLIMLAGAIYVIALPLFLLKALVIYSTTDRLLAWTLFVIGTIPIFRAIGGARGVPLLPLVSAQYVLFFSLPVFFEQVVHLQLGGWSTPSDTAVELTLLSAIIAIVCIGIGFILTGRVLKLRFRPLLFDPDNDRLFWYGCVIVIGAFMLQMEVLSLLGIRQAQTIARPLGLAFSADLGVAILACLYHRGVLSISRKLVVVALLVASVVVGLAGGMFQNAAQPLLIWLVAGWVIRRKAPTTWLIVIAVAFFVLQPVKGVYRNQLMRSTRTYSVSERLGLYSHLVRDYWIGSGEDMQQVLSTNRQSASKRLSLLLSTAHYVEWTPYPIPYKNGQTLTYLAYTWIPRAIWPDKPLAQEANKVLPVEYDLQTTANLNTTMFGVGHLAEAYVNFGLAGLVPLFLFLGFLYRLPNLLLERRSTLATIAIFVSLAVAMFPIGSSIGDAFGGFVQQIVLQGVLLRVFTAKRARRGVPVRRMPAFATISASPGPRLLERQVDS